jgi:hypothetical protein
MYGEVTTKKAIHEIETESKTRRLFLQETTKSLKM